MKKTLDFISRIENVIIVIAFVLMVVTSFGQVVNRNLLELPAPWLEELAIYSMIYMALIGTEMGLRDDTQIRVTMFVDKMPSLIKKVLLILAKLIVLAFSIIIFKSSIEMLNMQITSGQTSPVLKIPMAIPYASLTISFGIIILIQGATLISMLINFNQQDRGGWE